jgi:hypothetical protein
MDTLYIDHDGLVYPVLDRFVRWTGSNRLRGALQRLVLDSMSRRNPRSADYMVKLISDRHVGAPPSVMSVAEVGATEAARIAEARQVVLLWRDGIGAGWSHVERFVFRHTSSGASVRVLSGRRREFELTPSVRRSFLVRRFLEKSLLPEIVLTVLFVAASPFLVCWDMLRGRY